MEVSTQYVKLAREGDKQSFALLYDQVAKDLYRVALYTLGNAHDAEDVVSETFIEAYKGIKNLREDDKFRAWIMRILSIRCKRRIAKYIERKQEIDMEEFIETPEDVSPETADCSERLTVLAALDTLAQDERTIVVMSVLQGYTTREIGEILGVPHGTVSSKLYRTLMKLRKKLEA